MTEATLSPTASEFLAHTEWRDATQTPLSGDASPRRYIRLTGGPRPALLMVAPPDVCGSQAPFLEMTAFLHSCGLRAPMIYDHDLAQGFILLEDFGDALVARLAERDAVQEKALYQSATDVLIALHGQPVPDRPVLGASDLAQMIDPLFEHYAPGFPKQKAAEATATLQSLLAALPDWTPTVALRDYHAENLVFLKGDSGINQIGLLDYQDAIVTHPAYDLASLLQDARRLIPDALEEHCLNRFIAGSGLADDSFRAGYRLIALQRNLRILGIFARLDRLRPGANYGRFQPIVWHHVQRMLHTPDCAPLAPLLKDLPVPEALA